MRMPQIVKPYSPGLSKFSYTQSAIKVLMNILDVLESKKKEKKKKKIDFVPHYKVLKSRNFWHASSFDQSIVLIIVCSLY